MITTDVIFKYGNTNVTFHTGGEDVMINATEMAKSFGNSKKALLLVTYQSSKGIYKVTFQVEDS